MNNKLKLLTASLVLAFILCGAVSAADSSNDDSQVESQLMNVNVPFVENQGQTDSEVSYYANTFYGTSYVTQDGITHQIIGEDNKTLVVKEQFLDSNGSPITFQAQGEDPSTTIVSYFKGNDMDNWQTNLPTYNFINLGEIYPGITVKLRATGSNIEKLFFVNPGANPDCIKIQMLGADGLTIDEEGNLVMESDGFPDVSMSQPIAFQENNNNIEANYQIKNYTYGFKIGNYDQNKQLTIDLTLLYNTYLGGTIDDFGYGIAVDVDGNTYITGNTDSTNFPTIPGAYQTSNAGQNDAFVTKLNPTGTALLYSTYLGGNYNDLGANIAVDGNGNAYITGDTWSTNFPTTPGAYQTSNAGSYDAFVTKLNPTGTELLYSTYLGGTNYDYGDGIAVDVDGNAYITGNTDSTNFPTTPGAYQTIFAGVIDAFVTKLNPTGTALLYSTYLGGTNADSGEGIAVDGDGNAYITGYNDFANFPTTPGAYQTSNAGNGDAFVTKLNPTGTALLYSTYLGGTNNDYGEEIAVDGDGNAYITGNTGSTNFPTTPGAYQTIFAGVIDAFVTKLNPTGTALLYSTYLGGTNYDYGEEIAVDGDGNAYITGVTGSTNFPTTPGAYQTSNAGGHDAFVAKFNLRNPQGDLYINSWSNKKNPNVGEIFTITFKLGNRGPDTAENVVFTLPLPDGVEFVGVNVDQGTATYDPVTRTITWTLGDVVVGDPYAWVRVRALNVGSFIFRPTLTTDTYDPNIESSIQRLTVNVQAAGGSTETVYAQIVGMQETGTPIVPLALAILSILGGIVSSRKNK